ncbi:MAG: helix-turn-helix domain-containing protein [Actinomycetota bacterium]|nr:helix-turn-helix domain-containing protein [Actinomycetota bacterium]
MDIADAVSVAAAARLLRLHESRVRDLVRRGSLKADKLGRDLVLDRADVLAFRERERRAGRPLCATNAWALLAILAGEAPGWARRTTLDRLRRRAHDAAWVVGALERSQARAHIMRWELLPADVARIDERPNLVRTGSAAAEHVSDLVQSSSQVRLDAYADARTLEELRRRFRPTTSAKVRPNVALRVPSHGWILERGPVAPIAVVAADLLLDPSQRVRRAGERILRAIVDDADRDS